MSLLSAERLTWASLTHSIVYTALLVVWIVPGLHPEEFVLGLSHGIGWIAMSTACLIAVRRRVIPMRVAVAVAVLGGVGPFFGTLEFFRARRVGAFS